MMSFTRRGTNLLFLGSLLGLIASGTSWYEHVLQKIGADVSGSLCNINGAFNCAAINASAYSEVFGFPLAAIGFTYYLIVLFGCLYAQRAQPERVFWGSLVLSSCFAVPLSVVLFFISKVEIGAFCLFCMLMYIANALIALGGWRGAGTYGAAGCIFAALDAPFQFLKALTGQSRQRLSLMYSWIILLGIVCVFAANRSLPFVLKNQTVAPVKVQSSLDAWSKQPLVTIPVSTTGVDLLHSDFSIGNPSAPVTIIEFSDYECSACRMKFPHVEEILKKYKNQIYFVTKNFPLDQSCNPFMPQAMHEHACYAAQFTRCVGEQGHFWDAFHYVFTEPLLDSPVARPQLTSAFFAWAKSSGFDLDAIIECMNSDRPLTKVHEDIDLSIRISVAQTPTFFVNGRKTNFELLEPVIQSILAKKS